MAFCEKCGTEIQEGVCPRCGNQKKSLDTIGTDLTTGNRNKWVAIILAFFLGGLGIHKFYLGRIGWGVVYVLFCWTGIPVIVGIIEAVIYLTMTDEEFAIKYAKHNSQY